MSSSTLRVITRQVLTRINPSTLQASGVFTNWSKWLRLISYPAPWLGTLIITKQSLLQPDQSKYFPLAYRIVSYWRMKKRRFPSLNWVRCRVEPEFQENISYNNECYYREWAPRQRACVNCQTSMSISSSSREGGCHPRGPRLDGSSPRSCCGWQRPSILVARYLLGPPHNPATCLPWGRPRKWRGLGLVDGGVAGAQISPSPKICARMSRGLTCRVVRQELRGCSVETLPIPNVRIVGLSIVRPESTPSALLPLPLQYGQ